MIVGFLACAVLVGMATGTATYQLTSSLWLGAAAYSAAGSVTLLALAAGYAFCHGIRRVFRVLPESFCAMMDDAFEQLPSLPVYRSDGGNSPDQHDESTDTVEPQRPIQPRRVTRPLMPNRTRPDRQNIVEFRTTRLSPECA